MKLGIVISTAEPENVFNALRLGNYATGQGDVVRVFLFGKGVELDRIEDATFNVRQQTESLLEAGGKDTGLRHMLEAAPFPGIGTVPAVDHEGLVRSRQGLR